MLHFRIKEELKYLQLAYLKHMKLLMTEEKSWIWKKSSILFCVDSSGIYCDNVVGNMNNTFLKPAKLSLDISKHQHK